MDYQRSRDAIEDAYRNEQTAFQREQWEATQAQWREEFEYEKMSNEQKLAYNYILQAIDAGGTPSDELLAKAGISREDFNAMKKQAASAGVGGTPKPKPGDETGITDDSVEVEPASTANQNAIKGTLPSPTADYLKNYAALESRLIQDNVGKTVNNPSPVMNDLEAARNLLEKNKNTKGD